MTDLRKTIIPKSDQINADDLQVGPRTIKVTKVSLLAEADQPVAIGFEGDNGKPYKPCKSMRRVLVGVWGPDGSAYIGRSMTLYRDEKVVFGGLAVGGIRISHMSGITDSVTLALTASKASRKPFTVKPLAVAVAAAPASNGMLEAEADLAASEGMATYTAFFEKLSKDERKSILPGHDARKKTAAAADAHSSGDSDIQDGDVI